MLLATSDGLASNLSGRKKLGDKFNPKQIQTQGWRVGLQQKNRNVMPDIGPESWRTTKKLDK